MPTIAIVGAGFSGTLTALNLLRFEHGSPSERPRIVLYERGPAFGPGVAYSTRSPSHFLNVPAGNMSAWEQDPSHFLHWLHLRFPATTGGSFVPRAWYGDYLRDQLDHARPRAGDSFDLRRASVRAIHRAPTGALVIEDDSGARQGVDRVVLALGNFPPPHPPGLDPALLSSPRYIADPWAINGSGAAALAAILPDEPVLIIGAGLTMMDVVMSLHARNHAGHLYAISRHGLLPRPHRSPARPPSGNPAPASLEHWDGRAKSLVRIIRAAVRENAARGVDWRDIIASLRPVTSPLWRKLDARERERFLLRLRSYWEIVRHRAAPETAAAVADLIAARQLTVRAGQLMSIRPDARSSGKLVEAIFRPRRSDNPQSLRVARIINALGPQSDIRRLDDPLVKQLLADGLISADPHGLGMNVDDRGASIGADGCAISSISVVGPLRKGQHWENTAVPELRRQTSDIARRCMLELNADLTAAWPPLRAGEAL